MKSHSIIRDITRLSFAFVLLLRRSHQIKVMIGEDEVAVAVVYLLLAGEDKVLQVGVVEQEEEHPHRVGVQV